MRRAAEGVMKLAALALAAVAGCSPAATATPVPTAPQSPTPAAPPATTTPAGPVYDNPVYARNFPDPHVIRAGDTYYAYSTADSGTNIPVIRSTDLAHWEYVGNALLAVPLWSRPGYTWAPGVIQAGDHFVLYYATRHAESDRQCLSLAVSDTPEGPYADTSTEPLVCPLDLGGAIDPYPFQDADGQLYLLWKNDGNCCGKPVGLWVQPLAADGLTLTGAPVELIQRDQAWERPLIEHPTMVWDGATYYLFYSANDWNSHEYAVGYAVCDSVTGPCTKPLAGPIFEYTSEALGPGGQAFFTDTDGDWWMAYHAWTNQKVGYPSGVRAFFIDPVQFVDGIPMLSGPTSDPQPLE
jgi:beta-xylosidase